MKLNVTYKELTIAAGILVAVLIVLTLWVKSPADQSAAHFTLSEMSLTTAVKSILSNAVSFSF